MNAEENNGRENSDLWKSVLSARSIISSTVCKDLLTYLPSISLVQGCNIIMWREKFSTAGSAHMIIEITSDASEGLNK